jgi:hypothetical protein
MMLDNPVAFVLFASIGGLIVGTALLLASQLFPYRMSDGPRGFAFGLRLAGVGYRILSISFYVLMIWLIALTGIMSLALFV